MDWEVVDRLFEGRPEEFVAARNALVKELRAAGDRDAAAEVGKLRRPTSTAFALNQVARHQPAVLDAALDARAALRAATEGAGRGEDTGLREATAADREASRALVAAAREVLGGDDPALAQRVNGTLLAAVLDPDVEATVRAGRLAAELDASALAFATGSASEDGGDGPMAAVVSLAERAEARKAKGGKGERRPAARTREEAAAEREAAAEAEAEAAAAEQEARDRRRARVEREQAVGRLERRVGRLAGKVAEIEEALASAREELAAAEGELADGRAALDAVADPRD